jgi:uncharacterized protein
MIPAVLSWSRRHRRVVLVGAACVVLLSAAGIRRLSFDTDVLSLLPRTGRVIPAFRTFVNHFGGIDALYIAFTAPEGHSISDYEEQIEGWIDRLRRAPEITRVDTGLVDPSRDLDWLADRQLLLLGGDALARALKRLDGEGMRAAVASRRELLTLPSPAIAATVRQDPLGFYDLFREQLGGAQAGVNLGISEGGYVTQDSRSRLLIAHPRRPPYDAQFSRSLAATLERIRSDIEAARVTPSEEEALPPLHVEFAGGHRIAVETEAVVKRESILNTFGSLALILPLLLIVFRSLWLVGVGPLPSALALVAVFGVLGALHVTLSAAATASAAMLFGLGVDGVVLLYVAYTLALGEGANPIEAVDGLTAPAFSMVLGMWTTAATFYGLMFVDFPSLQQLGALIGHSMVLCGVFTLVIVPALFPRTKPHRARRPLTMERFALWTARRRKLILVSSAVVTIAMGAAALKIRVDPTLDRLRSVTPGAVALEQLSRQFALPRDVYVILQQGSDLEGMLEANEQIRITVARAMPSAGMHAASALLPSEATQRARADAIRRTAISVDKVANALSGVAASEGFTPRSFEPFIDRLPRLLAAEHRLTFEGYTVHGLGDLVGRFVAKTADGWLLASYVFPPSEADVAMLRTIVTNAGSRAVLTGLPLVNRELAAQFLPQFVKGLAIGTLIVLVMIVVALRDWRMSLLALTPAAIGILWAAGILALARIELDLFALFAVVTFVGIGVDYGIHLVHRCRDRGHAGQAVSELAPVILVAAVITLAGYGTLVTSTYPPLRSIGVVSVVTILTLAAASLIVLPALLPVAAERSNVADIVTRPGPLV